MRNCVPAVSVHLINENKVERERERESEGTVFIDAVWCYVDQREMLMSDGEISTKIKSNAHFRLD